MTEPEPESTPEPLPAPEPDEDLPSLDQPVLDLGREAIRQALMAAVDDIGQVRADIAQIRIDLTALQDTVTALPQAAPPQPATEGL